MKLNGMCPLCALKRLFSRTERVTEIYETTPYENGIAKTPPMGWSSWNTFKNNISEDLILETAHALVDSGLADAGYRFVNLDDNWHSSMRDSEGLLQGDLTRFPNGIKSLVEKLSKLNLKTGIYSSNGTHTCEDLPASLYNESRDALTFARWGIEYFKYDFCHNEKIPSYAPIVYGIDISVPGNSDSTKEYLYTEAKLEGFAKVKKDASFPTGGYVVGLDRNAGAMVFDVNVPTDGEYVLTVKIKKKGKYEKYLLALINESDYVEIPFPPQNQFNKTARFQAVVKLLAGSNTIRLFNPIVKRADSAMLQYKRMGKALIAATKQVAAETNSAEKPITFSICEWGLNRPFEWGASAGNLWRTTFDIQPKWVRIMIIYNINVRLYEYAQSGGFNDPDMLEVGNGNLTPDENYAHFALWCMMTAPLILGNDLRKLTDEVKAIVTDKELIAIDQDSLCKQAKRIYKGRYDVLVKPLSDGTAAVLVFNKATKERKITVKIKDIIKDGYAEISELDEYEAYDLYKKTYSMVKDTLEVTVPAHGARVFKLI